MSGISKIAPPKQRMEAAPELENATLNKEKGRNREM